MEFDDYMKYIGYVTVGYYLDNFKDSYFQTSLAGSYQPAYYTLNNPVKQHLYLAADAVAQYQFMDERCSDEKKTGSSAGRREVTFYMEGQS